ncbi:MAG: efflux RND transporter permease subunit [Bacteroidetes bacterium]|nr:efflux RND transporter permease subunit [Bacteroidota bacterium]
MKKLLTTFVKYPFYANIIIAFAVLAGGLSLLSMKKSFFPESKSRFINVSVSYPGASPKEMEEGVTSIIEESIRGIVGIKEITSNSSENFAQVRIETTGEYDLDETLTEVKNAVDGISSFPVDAEKPTVFKVRTTTPAARLGLAGDVDLQTLKKYANEIEEDFLASGKMSQINIGGYPDLEISVEVPEENLLRYKLTIDQISQAISQNNRDFSAGQIKSNEEEILIRARSRSVDPNIIGEIILRANIDGSFLRIRDVANVKLQFADVSSATLMNGKTGIFISVQKLAEEDLEDIVNYIENYKDEFNAKHANVNLELTFNFLELLRSRLNLLINNGGFGLILVVMSLAFFLSFRLSLWVAWGIPSSFMMMFVVANLMGITINMISLFGMILVIGILVDDGIVIAENIFTHFEMGKSPKRAAIDGTMEVKGAVLTSVTTTIVAFMPLVFLEGSMEMMKEMAYIVIFSLGFSLLEAFFVLPAHLSSPHILRVRNKERRSGKVKEKTEAVVIFLRDKLYAKILKEIIKWRWIVVTVPIALILITMGMIKGTIIRTTFFPAVTFDFFSVDVAFTPGSGEKQTMEFLKTFDEKVWEVNSELEEEFSDTNTFVTYTFVGLGNSFNGNERGSHAGNIFVLLRDMEGAPISSFDIVKKIKDKIGDVPEASKFTVGGVQRFGKPISVSLLSKNLKELDLAKEFFIEELQNISSLKNVTDNNALGKQEILLKLKPNAYYLGLTQAQISTQVRQGFYGEQIQRLQHGKDEIRVWVRYPQEDRLNVGKLENMKIKTAKGEFPLTELVTYSVERGPVNIQRYNGSREVRVEADLLNPFDPVPPILENINEEIIPQIKSKFPGVKIEYQGQQRGSDEAVAEIQKYFGIAFAVILLILILHFRSFSQMILTIMMIPLAFLGAAWGHGIHGHPISILSAWGMVALSGVVINDAVVFLTKYNQLLLEGLKVQDAAFNAGIQRFRAIMLTTITTVLGLFPLILEKSFQAQFLIPMAISLAYGVLIGTGFILLFLPVLALTLNDTKVFIKNKLFGKNVNPEDMEPVVIYDKVTIE